MKSTIILALFLWSSAQAADFYPEAKKVDSLKETFFSQSVFIEYNNEKLDLSLTGETIRKKFFLKIYSMAHYVQQKPNAQLKNKGVYQYILQQHGAKQISMIFLRALKAKQIQKSLLAGIKLNTNEDEFSQILPQVEAFMRAINEDVKENDEFILRWLPDGTMVSLFQGKQISSIKGENFAKTIWSIWFGESSVIDRDLLIKELLTSS
jgi:hypothetical protein